MKKYLLLLVSVLLLSSCDGRDDSQPQYNKDGYYAQLPKSKDFKGFWRLTVTDGQFFFGVFLKKATDYYCFDDLYMRRLYLYNGVKYYNYTKEKFVWFGDDKNFTYVVKNMGDIGPGVIPYYSEYQYPYKMSATKDTIYLKSDKTAYLYRVEPVEFSETDRFDF